MDIKLKSYDSLFLFCLVYILTIQPIFSRVEPPVSPHCGHSKPIPRTTIIGGKQAARGAWPWAALLGYTTNTTAIRFRCGGTLLSSKTVGTAGHCVYGDLKATLKLVRLGAHHLDHTKDTPKPVDYTIHKIIPHPGYDNRLTLNDVALLILEKAVQFTDFIMPICLPFSKDLLSRRFHNTSPTVVGWGSITADGPMHDVILEVEVPVVDNNQCKLDYSMYNDSYVVDERVLCAGYREGGKDSCKGDSGGPLVLRIDSTYYLIGITSVGFGCAEPKFPGIYTRVTHFVDFIKTHFE